VSLPFSFSGDPLYKNEKVLKELLTKAKEISKDAKYLEIRMRQKLPDGIAKDYGLNENMGTYLTAIELTDIDTVLSNMDRDKRRYINKAGDKGLKVREGNENDLKAYHALKMKLSAKKYGIPSEPLSFYNNLWKQMHSKNMIKLFVAEFEGKLVGGIVLLMYKDEVLDFSGAADDKYLHLKPYNFLIWEALKYSCKNKYKYFNFGTSKNKSLMDFKESWGAKSVQIPVYSTNTPGKGIEYNLFTKTWKKIPTFITRLLGPFLVKQKGG
jgi:lipid II:glycine glycyltransferase (peptidoglycan interpeptide bridge formation enzyme)